MNQFERESQKEKCMENLRVISKAIEAYKADHQNKMPDWLSDLYPEYLQDTKFLLCPADETGSPPDLYKNLKDPKMACSYGYQFNPTLFPQSPAGFYIDLPKNITYMEAKTIESKYFGGLTPVIVCRNHSKMLINLGYNGRVYINYDIYLDEYDWTNDPETINTVILFLQEIIEDSPTGWEKEVSLDKIYWYFRSAQRRPELLTILEKIKDPSADVLKYLSELYHLDGKMENEIETVRNFLNIKPDDIDFRLRLAGLYGKTGRYNEAREQCLEVIRQKSDSEDSYNLLAELDAVQDSLKIKERFSKLRAEKAIMHYLAKMEEMLFASESDLRAKVDEIHDIAQNSFGESGSVTRMTDLYQKLGKTLINTKGQWQTYNTTDGLLSNWIKSIAQDKNGILWLGTGAGISLYDGETFTTFSMNNELRDDSLPWQSIYRILIDRQERIWISTNLHGIFRYDGKDMVNYTKENGFDGSYIFCMLQDKNDVIWFGCSNGLIRYDGKEFRNFTASDGLPSDQIQAVAKDKNGILWIGTSRGVSRYDGNTFTNLTKKDGLVNDDIRSILQDSEGNLWFGAMNGISKYDGNSFTNFPINDYYIGDVINIMEDRNGRIWFTNRNQMGVSCYDGEKFTFFTVQDGLAGGYVNAMFEDREGNIWFGHDTGDGLTKFNPNGMKVYGVEDGLAGAYVRSIAEDSKGDLWIATHRGICKYDGKAFTQPVPDSKRILGPISKIMNDSKGNLWFATSRNPFIHDENIFGGERGIFRFDGTNFINFTTLDGLVSNDITCMIEDRNGNIWMGSCTAGWRPSGKGGISRYDGKTFTNFTTASGLGCNEIAHLTEDNKGNIWAGTFGGGAIKYDGKVFTSFTSEDGLANNGVFQIYADKQGRIWIGTMNGTNLYDGESFITPPQLMGKSTIRDILEDQNGRLWFGSHNDGITRTDGKAFVQITKNDGLPANEIHTLHEDRNGDVWIGTSEGLVRYTPNPILPLIRIESVIADKVYTDLKNISLSSMIGRITISYRGSSFRTRPGVMQYFYQMEGYDKDWQEPTKEHSVDYFDLKPGKYIFRVKAIDIDLNYSEPASLEITIQSLFEPIPNPYMAGGPVRSRDMFFGREADFKFVSNKLKTEKEGIVIVFYGQRRSGKTSLLHQILNRRLGEGFMPVLIDMQEMAVNKDDEFYEKIADEVSIGLSGVLDIDSTAYNFHSENPARVFERFIDSIMKRSEGKTLVLMFDEYELLEEKMQGGILRGDTATFFAGILERHKGISFIFTGSRNLERRDPHYWGVLFGKSIARRISLLSEEDTLRLIKEPISGAIKYQRDVPHRIYRLTGGQPFYTQHVCQLLIERLNNLQRNRVYADDVEKTALELVDNPPPQMMYFWNEELDAKEKLVLVLLGRILNRSDDYASSESLVGYASNIKLDVVEIANILNGLCQYELLERERITEEKYEYRYKIDFFRYWVQRHQSIAQVIRDISGKV